VGVKYFKQFYGRVLLQNLCYPLLKKNNSLYQPNYCSAKP
jgi:hypothetical protein